MELYELEMGFLLELAVAALSAAPLSPPKAPPLDELTEEVRDRFRLCSSTATVSPRFREPGLGMSWAEVPLGRRGSKADCALPPLSLRLLLLLCVSRLRSSSTSLFLLSFSTFRTLSLEQGSASALGSSTGLHTCSKLCVSGRAIFTVTGLHTEEFLGLRTLFCLKPSQRRGGKTPTGDAPCWWRG